VSTGTGEIWDHLHIHKQNKPAFGGFSKHSKKLFTRLFSFRILVSTIFVLQK